MRLRRESANLVQSMDLTRRQSCPSQPIDETAKRPRSLSMANDPDIASEDDRADSSLRDAEDMRRMGREPQLVRRFRFLSIVAFTSITTVSWEYGLMTMGPALVNGGRAGAIYSTIWTFIGFGPVYLSMAEMASMAPTAGGQYHWVSELGPESCQKVLSYLVGWCSTIAWQGGNATDIFMLGSVLQCIIAVLDDQYQPKPYQSFLLAILAVGIAYVGNVYGARIMPYWQNAVFLVHIMALFAYIVPIWVSAPIATNQQVWLDFSSSGGWDSTALSLMIGQMIGLSNQVSIDSAAHMAEEVKDAAITVPRAMILVYVTNFVLLFPTILTAAYHMPDLDQAMADTTGYPALHPFRQVVSTTWTVVFLSFLAILFTAGTITYVAVVTRDMFAFARDQGLPFSAWISKVDDNRSIPVNSAILTSGMAFLLALIYLGSTSAYYAVISLFAASIMASYMFSIGCVLWRRLFRPNTLPPARFSLGRAGLPINLFATVFCLYSSFWSFWPQQASFTVESFNWAAVIFGSIMILAMIYYMIWARHRYTGPVVLIEGRKVR